MSSSFTFKVTPIFTLSNDGIISNLIQIANVNLLFDCGIDSFFSPSVKKRYLNLLSTIPLNAIFLTNNFLHSFGALPLIKSLHLNTNTIVCATPVLKKLGEWMMTEYYINARESNIIPFQLEEEKNFSSLFSQMKEWNFKQSIRIKTPLNENDEIVISPLPSGNSFGGTAWRISYKLKTWLYAPQFEIESKLTTDPFPYQSPDVKGVNYLITDTLMNNNLKVAIDGHFKRTLIENLDNKKNIFIPYESANLELILKLQKIIEEYIGNRNDKPKYEMIICGNRSKEIIEEMQRLKEFMSEAINKSDLTIDTESIHCVRDIAHYRNKINVSLSNVHFITLASLSSLDYGLAHDIIPILLNDVRTVMIVIDGEFKENTVLYNVIKSYVNGEKKINFERRVVIERITPIEDDNEKEKEEDKVQGQMKDNDKKEEEEKNKEDEAKKEIKVAEIIHSSLFQTESKYMMFKYDNSAKYSQGIVLTEDELSVMTIMNKSLETENYQSKFQESLDKDQKKQKEEKLKLKKYAAPIKFSIDNCVVPIKCEILIFPIVRYIDAVSKSIVLEEIAPKDGIIFLGNIHKSVSSLFKNYKEILFGDTFEKKVYLSILKFNYDSSLFSKGKRYQIENNDKNLNLFDFKPVFLKIKRKGERTEDICVSELDNENGNVNDKREYSLQLKQKQLNGSENEAKASCFYSGNDFELLEVKRELEKMIKAKRELEKVANEPLYIENKCIVTSDRSIKIKFKNNELILEGAFSPEYIQIKSFISLVMEKQLKNNK